MDKPDLEQEAIVKEFEGLRVGAAASNAVKATRGNHVRTRLAIFRATREVEFVGDFVLWSSGKISRRLLREVELAQTAKNG